MQALRLKKRPHRNHAMNWLAENHKEFPLMSAESPIGEPLFHGWRFILAEDNNVYFANCIDAGITQSDIDARRELLDQQGEAMEESKCTRLK